jgi:prepilin-type N-terminal cleavage/methylation domain-containing protein
MKSRSKQFQISLNHIVSYPSVRRHRSGFTLIESLVAIMVISITVVAITPPIFWATGTRVQNRRAEQALALAQGEIDRVRAEIERGGTPKVTDLPQSIGAIEKLDTWDGPGPKAAWDKMRSTNITYNTAEGTFTGDRYPATNQYVPVDTDGDGTADFLVQVFRNNGVCDKSSNPATPCLATDTPRSFSMMVRVYAGLATQSTLPKLDKTKASLTGSTGSKQSGFRPLAVLYSKVAKSVDSGSLNRYRSP